MTANHKVDWRKTCSNISSRLSGLAWAKDVAPVFHLSIREAQHKLTGQELSVEELSLYASLFGCSIDDLLVFEHDHFVEPEHSNVSKRQKMELSTIVEITDTIDFNAKHFRNCEIQNLMEFLFTQYVYQNMGLHQVKNSWQLSNRKLSTMVYVTL